MKLIRIKQSLRKNYHLLMWKILNLNPKSTLIFKTWKLKLQKIMRLLLGKEKHSCLKTKEPLQPFKNWKSNYQTSKLNMTKIEFYGRISLLFYNNRKTKQNLINKIQQRNLRLSLSSYKREAQPKRTNLKILIQRWLTLLKRNLSSN